MHEHNIVRCWWNLTNKHWNSKKQLPTIHCIFSASLPLSVASPKLKTMEKTYQIGPMKWIILTGFCSSHDLCRSIQPVKIHNLFTLQRCNCDGYHSHSHPHRQSTFSILCFSLSLSLHLNAVLLYLCFCWWSSIVGLFKFFPMTFTHLRFVRTSVGFFSLQLSTSALLVLWLFLFILSFTLNPARSNEIAC